ncbi:MAG: 50S ribosomal protein L11 methyltransferase [Pseudomonadota bacterium]
MTDEPQLQSVTLDLLASLPEAVLFDVASVLDDEATSVSWVKTKDNWTIQWVFNAPAPVKQLIANIQKITKLKISLADITITDVKNVNWLEESYRSFPPFTIGPFFIFGSHYDGKIPKNNVPLQIDAATAFGSGEHGTTRGCLEALAFLKTEGFKPKHILDMGAGSGILGIGAHKLWKKPTLAIDIDKEATRMAAHHRRINNVPAGDDGMRCATGDGYAARPVGKSAGVVYDLIIANILAGPLVHMAPDLATCLSKKGMAILSGLLIEQEKDVLTAHKAHGLSVVKRITHGEWRTLVLSSKKV